MRETHAFFIDQASVAFFRYTVVELGRRLAQKGVLSQPDDVFYLELPELRRKTESVSRFLRDQIAEHLETLRPLFAPERTLGKYAGGKVEV